VARADVPGGSYTDSQAASINDRGQVVGSASLACCDFGRPTQAGFVWQAGTWTLLDFLPLVFTTDINALGQVVGAAAIEHAPTDTCCNAFVWQASTGPRPVPLGSAHAINNRGQIVGQPRFVNRAFVWQEGTQLQELGTLGGCCSDAEGITNGGQVAGWSTTAAGEAHAVLWEPAR
jgi:probable HAF family extracellular repeat protein